MPATQPLVHMRPVRGPNRYRGRPVPLVTLALALLAALAACVPTGADETALSRGDEAFARDSLDEALAEYRLAVRQGSDDPEALARVAHTYVRLEQVDEAWDFYRQAVEADESLTDQAVSDFVHLARTAADRGDRFLMASAMDAALTLRPGVTVEEMALPLARHYFGAGEYGRALPFYQRALSVTNDSSPELVFEIGQAHEEIGDCEGALGFFERYRDMTPRWERSEVDWYVGSCAFQVAREKRVQARSLQPGRTADTASSTVPADSTHPPPASRRELLEEALRLIDRTLEVQQPRNLLGQAWFERGEILAALGDCQGALDAFERVPEVEPSRDSALSRRAQERYDRIFFGRGLRDMRTTGSCG